MTNGWYDRKSIFESKVFELQQLVKFIGIGVTNIRYSKFPENSDFKTKRSDLSLCLEFV